MSTLQKIDKLAELAERGCRTDRRKDSEETVVSDQQVWLCFEQHET